MFREMLMIHPTYGKVAVVGDVQSKPAWVRVRIIDMPATLMGAFSTVAVLRSVLTEAAPESKDAGQ